MLGTDERLKLYVFVLIVHLPKLAQVPSCFFFPNPLFTYDKYITTTVQRNPSFWRRISLSLSHSFCGLEVLKLETINLLKLNVCSKMLIICCQEEFEWNLYLQRDEQYAWILPRWVPYLIEARLDLTYQLPLFDACSNSNEREFDKWRFLGG